MLKVSKLSDFSILATVDQVESPFPTERTSLTARSIKSIVHCIAPYQFNLQKGRAFSPGPGT